MNRLVLLLLVLAGCHRGPDAVRVRVQLAPDLKATCIALDVLSLEGQLLGTQWVERTDEAQEELRIAVFQGGLPKDIQLQARALWGSKCDDSSRYNGRSELETASFQAVSFETVTVVLARPSSDEDADHDGFVSSAFHGPDCEDQQENRHPGQLEGCGDTVDLDCDGHLRCEDPVCANQACDRTPVSLSFPQEQTSAVAGDCVSLTVELRDARGKPTVATADIPVQLDSGSPDGPLLYQNARCKVLLKEPSIPKDRGQLTFFTQVQRSGGVRLTASALNSTATTALTVRPGPVARLRFTPSADLNLLAGQCSNGVAVYALDPFDNLTPPLAGTSLALTSSANPRMDFFASPDCSGSPISALAFMEGASSASFSFKGITGGVVELTASLADGRFPVKQTQSVVSAVRSGTCQIASGAMTVDCAISPALRKLEDSFFVFQATTTSDTPGASFIRCALRTPPPTILSTLTCSRAASDSSAVKISWQAVELPTGVKVQHYPGVACAGTTTDAVTTSQPLDSEVRPENTFVLFSTSQQGSTSDDNDFMAVRLADSKHVELSIAGLGCFNNLSSLQVVQFDGASVLRGALAMTGPSATASALASVNQAQSMVLSTYSVKGASDSNICNRMIRGTVSSPTELTFNRGAVDGTGGACPAPTTTSLSYERIAFLPEVKVQTHELVIPEGGTVAQTTLMSPVDATRTLLLTSSQSQGGQASGETSYNGNDIVGTASGRLSLSGSTLSVTRDTGLGAARWTVYVIQLKP